MVCIPVLIHVNGVSDQLMAENYFYSIIDFGSFLRESELTLERKTPAF